MNVLKLLKEELKDKDWTLEEKARYIYIRSCQLFSYDERYDYYNLYFNGDIRLHELRNKLIDLENVIDNRVVCTSFSKSVLSILIEELLSIECKNRGLGHAFNLFLMGEQEIMADATISSDLTRCKMGLNTHGYRKTSKDFMFETNLKEIDKKIGYIKDEYENYYIKQKNDNLFLDFVQENPEYTKDDFLIYKLATIKELFDSYKNLKNYNDCEHCISYLQEKIIGKDPRRIPSVPLFDLSYDEIWKFVEIFPFRLENEIIYYILEEIDNEYCFYEISESDAKSYAKTLRGLRKDDILKLY